jgi:hypothetical protein
MPMPLSLMESDRQGVGAEKVGFGERLETQLLAGV